MTDRSAIEQVLSQLYSARVDGQLDRLCGLFANDARFRISGATDGKPIAISARGLPEIRSWLAMLIKTFRINHREAIATLIDDSSAAVHWRADIHSKITGVIVRTELVDLVEVRGGSIVSYTEFFVPC
jgi:ketosteroid isomerase-like protein